MARVEATPPPFQCWEKKRENMTHILADVRRSDPKCQINIERGEGVLLNRPSEFKCGPGSC